MHWFINWTTRQQKYLWWKISAITKGDIYLLMWGRDLESMRRVILKRRFKSFSKRTLTKIEYWTKWESVLKRWIRWSGLTLDQFSTSDHSWCSPCLSTTQTTYWGYLVRPGLTPFSQSEAGPTSSHDANMEFQFKSFISSLCL